MTSQWQPYQEPLRTTLLRTGMIAIIGGAVLARFSGGGLDRWPLAALMMLWPSFGGHWVELWFLNWLRPRLPIDRRIQIVARIVVWFAGGVFLGIGMGLTAVALVGFPWERWPSWWLAGSVFIGVELVAQFALELRGRPSFYNGRG